VTGWLRGFRSPVVRLFDGINIELFF